MNRRRGRVIHVRRRRGPFRFRRVLLTSLIAFVCVFCAYHIVEKLARPYLVGRQEKREIAQIKRETAAVEAENVDIERQIAYLQTPAGAEAEARRLGMVKEGEVALIVESAEKADSEQAEKMSHPTAWQKIVSGIAGLFVRDRKPVPKG